MKPKEVIFLDIDGVLNNAFFFITNPVGEKPAQLRDNYGFMKTHVDEQNMKVLKYILEQLPEVKIIISSAWGAHFEVELFNKLLREFKIKSKKVIDITPRKMSSDRCHEIGMSIDDYPSIEKWLAVDDHPIFSLDSPKKPNEYLVDSYVGLTYNDAVKIIKHFKPEWKPMEIWL